MTGVPLVAACAVIPFAGAIFALVAGARAGRWIGLGTSAAAAGAAGALAVQVLAHGPLRHRAGGWGAPLGIDLQADGLSALMLVMTAAVGFAVSVHAFGYFEDHAPAPDVEEGRIRRLLFWPLWLFLWGALAALFVARDVFHVYVTLELVGLAAVALVALAGDPAAIGAAARYLILALLASLAYLLGVALVYGSTGTLDMDALRGALPPGLLATASAALVVAGLALKAALFPLHGWLPPAHAGAPAPVSAALSALVVKGAFYLVVRWAVEVLPPAVLRPAELMLGVLGASAIAWGSLQAFRQERLKQVIAYSTVAQVGYLFLFFPLARGIGAADALAGAAIFALAHGLAKASLFLSAGCVLHGLGSDRLAALRGLGSRMPLTAAALAIASVSILALPPSGGFAGKWFLLSAAISSGRWWWAIPMLAGAVLAAGYAFRVLERVIGPAADDAAPHAPLAMQLAALGLAIGAISVGLAPWAPLALLAAGPPLAGGGP
jgi:multicomponent Na+:H+ antiporter subunit D